MSTATPEIVAEGDPGARLKALRFPVAGHPYARMGPVGHLHEERARLRALTWKHFEARPLGSTIGAELAGVDLREELADAVIEEIHQALLDYKVLFFRDQPVTPEQQVAFARRFGELEIHPFIPSNTGVPELVRFEKSADVGGYENLWHHDVTWRERPSKAGLLHAISVPETGGDTLFCDAIAAYEGLDDEWKTRIENLDVVHDYLRAFGHNVPKEKRDEMRAQYPPVQHPAAPAHPDTGRRHLYVNFAFADHVVGVSQEESRDILQHLALQSEVLEYQCRFHWTPDSIAFWDNRAVQHYAASDYWPDVRVMERASIVGARPSR